ncbi:MAG TPA: hypothetical protein VFA89_21050 [Terriglobales bacterium]|nr:hypothetical protein [Terriglobales bacterium]
MPATSPMISVAQRRGGGSGDGEELRTFVLIPGPDATPNFYDPIRGILINPDHWNGAAVLCLHQSPNLANRGMFEPAGITHGTNNVVYCPKERQPLECSPNLHYRLELARLGYMTLSPAYGSGPNGPSCNLVDVPEGAPDPSMAFDGLKENVDYSFRFPYWNKYWCSKSNRKVDTLPVESQWSADDCLAKEEINWNHCFDKTALTPDKSKARLPNLNGRLRALRVLMNCVDALHRYTRNIGCIGHSVGGGYSYELAFIDPRVRAVVCSGPGFGPWDGLAPRPVFYALTNDLAKKCVDSFNQANIVYRQAFGAPPRVQWPKEKNGDPINIPNKDFPYEHDFPCPSRQQAYDFLSTALIADQSKRYGK